MHPERRGQGRSGRIDWTVAGMDAIGLVLFFIPGVIAFAIDYHNGTLFYPDGGEQAQQGQPLRSRQLSQRHPSREEIAEAVSQIVGRPISLTDEVVVNSELKSIDEFWTKREDLVAQVHRRELTVRCQSQ